MLDFRQSMNAAASGPLFFFCVGPTTVASMADLNSSVSWVAVSAQAIVIGLSIAAPVGPIGLLTIQRSLEQGRAAGLATSLGAAVADALYGGAGAYACSVPVRCC